MSIAITSDGNVVVSDLGNRAWIVFRPTGEHVRSVSVGDASAPLSACQRIGGAACSSARASRWRRAGALRAHRA
jgi:hypothetical protein